MAGGIKSQGNEHARLDDGNFFVQVGAAGMDFILLGPSVFGQMALHQVGHVDLVPVEDSLFEKLVNDGPSWADKHPAFPVLLFPRGLGDEQQAGIRTPFSREGIVPGFGQPASLAGLHFGLDCFQGVLSLLSHVIISRFCLGSDTAHLPWEVAGSRREKARDGASVGR